MSVEFRIACHPKSISDDGIVDYSYQIEIQDLPYTWHTWTKCFYNTEEEAREIANKLKMLTGEQKFSIKYIKVD